MTSAEQFVNDNLERGHSLEDIRLLAEDCEQPLAEEIRAVVAARECARRRAERLAVSEQSEASEVACETAMYHAVSAGEEAVFLIGPGEETETATDGIDFDLMQGGSAPDVAPVLEEESIADIVIGETDGSDIIHAADAGARAMAEEEEAGIWSRLWTRVAGGPVPSVAPSVRMPVASAMEPSRSPETSLHEDDPAMASEPMMDAEEPVMFAVDDPAESNDAAIPDFNPAEAAASEPDATPLPDPATEMATVVSEPAGEPEAVEEEQPVCENRVDEPVAGETGSAEAMMNDAMSEAVSVMAESEEHVSEPDAVDEEPIHDMHTATAAPVEPEAASATAEPVEEMTEELVQEMVDEQTEEPVRALAEELVKEAEPVGNDVEVGSEMSSDYLPGSVVLFDDKSDADGVPEEDNLSEIAQSDAAEELQESPQAEDLTAIQEEATDAVTDAVREESAEIALEALTQSIVTEAPETGSDSSLEPVGETEPVSAVVPEADAEVETAGATPYVEEVIDHSVDGADAAVTEASDEPVAEEGEEQAESLAEIPAVSEDVAEVAEVADTAETAETPESADAAETAEESKVSRRERRRQERAEKKRKRKQAKADKAVLPEIVLTRSEGTETLTPVAESESESESGEFAAAVDESESFVNNAADPVTIAENAYSQDEAVPAAGAAVTDAIDGADAAPEQPRMSRPMSLVTPNDVFEDADSASFVTLFAAAMADMEGPQLSIVTPDASDRGEESAATDDEAESMDSDVASTYSGDDHYMIIANGGVHQDEISALHLVDTDAADAAECPVAETGEAVLELTDTSDDSAESEEMVESASADDTVDGGANVILFRENFPFLAQSDDDDGDDNDGNAMRDSGPVLHLLPPVEEAAGDDSAPAEAGIKAIAMAERPLLENTMSPAGEPSFPAALAHVAPLGDHLTAESRAGILLAMYGTGTVDDLVEPADAIPSSDGTAEADGEHAIVSMEPFPDYAQLFEQERDLRRDLEDEYQLRLDGFAARLLDVQTAGGQTEEKLRNAKAELDARAAVLEEMKNRLAKEEEAKADLARRLECATAEMNSRERELDRVRGLRDEHQRLFNEFEDLRKAYNEVVSDVMPTLQNERDDLALTVERQCAEERQVRSQLGATRRRLTVGYGLGVAASLVLIALPVANWLKSSERARETAESEQLLSELRDNLQTEVEQNIRAQNEIVELQNKIGLARAQIVDLQSKNRELAQVRTRVMQPDSDIAVFRPESAGGGTPTRASTMALQATPPADGRLHVNEVRDPAGSIEQVVAMNRARNQGEDQVAVRPAGTGQAGGRMQVSA
ncbi:MAG: hypothetical protein LIQ31_06470, partial [Planctomycetes bacterium]|nr:hypothetical protein [Planctomycetota bacterium]